MKKVQASLYRTRKTGNTNNIRGGREKKERLRFMNRKIYKFESHKNIQDSKYYCEVLCRNDKTFYLQFVGNKNSKYGAYVGYKQKIGRRGTKAYSGPNEKLDNREESRSKKFRACQLHINIRRGKAEKRKDGKNKHRSLDILHKKFSLVIRGLPPFNY